VKTTGPSSCYNPDPRAGGAPASTANAKPTPQPFPGAGRGLDQTAASGLPRSIRSRTIRQAAPLALLLLAACDPFKPDDPKSVIVTPVGQCENLGGTPTTRPAKDGTPWKVCTFPDTRVCDLAKLRVDNRCYTTVPDTAPDTAPGT
jgi:hypothetical protein